MKRPGLFKSAILSKLYIGFSILLLIALFFFRSELVQYGSNLGSTGDEYTYESDKEVFEFTLIEFGLNFCAECKAMHLVLEEVKETLPKTVKIIFADLSKDEYKQLADKYNIISIPSQLIFNKSGKEVFRHTGYISFDDLSKHLILN